MDIEDFKNQYQKAAVKEWNHSVPAQPKVSVLIQTYNHELYIEQCLNSILNQQTEFDFEILLGEDNSTDGTRDICLRYAEAYPNKIRLFLHTRENNISIAGRPSGRFNFLFNLTHARGDYLALCEGDDFWIDDRKLQKQVDFLDKNKSFTGVFHPAKQWYEDTEISVIRSVYQGYDPVQFSLKRVLFLGGGFFPTAALMFKKDVINDCDLDLWTHATGDYPLALLIVAQGKLGYLPEPMSVYRIQSQSVSNFLFPTKNDCQESVSIKHRLNIDFIQVLQDKFQFNRKIALALKYKENYILLSKYLDCGCITCAFAGIFKYSLSLKLLLRLCAKSLVVLVKRRGKGIKIKK